MNFNTPLRHFITGGAGFIGSYLVSHLLAREHETTVYDNLSSGRREWIAHLEGHPRFRFIHGDMLDVEKLRSGMEGHDAVWHLGANTDIPSGFVDTELDLKNCILATRNVLESMRANRIDKIMFSSTSAVYGEPSISPTPETYAPLRPISLYGASKLANEGQVSAYAHLFGFQVWTFRFANIIGGRMSHGVIYDFIQKLKSNPRTLDVMGDGYQEKSYVLVEDCVEGMLCAVGRTDEWFDVFNLGCRSRTKVRRIAQILIDEMGLEDVEIRYLGGKRGFPGDVPSLLLDVGKVEALGWRARRSSDEAVRIAVRRMLGREPLEG